MGKDIANGSAEERHGCMRNMINSGYYKRSGLFAAECGRDEARELGKSQIESFFFFFNVLTKSWNIIQKAIGSWRLLRKGAKRLDVCFKQTILVAVWKWIGWGDKRVRKPIRKLLKRLRWEFMRLLPGPVAVWWIVERFKSYLASGINRVDVLLYVEWGEARA